LAVRVLVAHRDSPATVLLCSVACWAGSLRASQCAPSSPCGRSLAAPARPVPGNRVWAWHRDGLERPLPIEAPGMLTNESFKSQRIRGPAPKSQTEVTGYQGVRSLASRPPKPHPAAPRGLGHSTSARHRRDVAEAADERRAPRAPPDGGCPRDRPRVLPAPSDRGAPLPVALARRRSAAAPARSPGPDAVRRARSPGPTADDPPLPLFRSPDLGSTW
jgi:hypothetical protein